MNINFSYNAMPTPTDIVRVIAYKASDPGVEVTMVEFNPPHVNPRDVSLFVPSPVVHILKIYHTPDSISVGVLKAIYTATPSFDGPIVIPPLMIKVDGGRADRDPVDSATEVAITTIVNYTISWVEQRGAGPLIGGNDTDDPLQVEWIPRIGGGLTLQNGKTFYHDDEYWIFFEPTLDGNVSAAIQDLTDLLEDHINDTDNPHAVTKTQVGLGNLPNAISDSYQLNSSVTLATSKAVYDLWQSLTGQIVGKGKIFVGDVVTDKLVLVTHNLGIVGDYIIAGSLQSTGSDWNNDNDVMWMVRNLIPNSFEVLLREVNGTIQQLWFCYVIVKV